MRKEIKKIVAATLSLALLVGVGSVENSSAHGEALSNSLFSFDIRHNYLKSHDDNDRKRDTTDTENAWGVQLNTSKETKKNKSVTIFYLGIKTTKGQYNDYGSDKHKVHVGWGMRYYTAYEKAGNKNVLLYGMDNTDGTTDAYHVTGYWSPQTGKDPANDTD